MPPSCFNSPSFSPCSLCPASDRLPLLPPPGQRSTLHQPGLQLKQTVSLTPILEDQRCAPSKATAAQGPVGQRQLECPLTCGGGRDTVHRPLYFRLVLGVARQQSSLSVCQDPTQDNKMLWSLLLENSVDPISPRLRQVIDSAVTSFTGAKCAFVLLGYFDFDMDIVVSIAVASDTSDSLPRQTDPLVGLDACRYLKTMGRKQSFITRYASGMFPRWRRSLRECVPTYW